MADENPNINDVQKKGVYLFNIRIFRFRNLLPLWISVFIDVLGFYIMIPFLSTLQNIFNTTTIVVGMILAVNAVFTLFFAPILGKLSDKYGRKPLLLISQAGTFSAFLILAFSNTLWLIFLSRVIDGIFGGNFPIAKAIISDEVPPRERGLQMTNIGVVHVTAGLIGPALSAFLSVFLIFGPNYPLALPGLTAAGLSLATMIITALFLKESWPKDKRTLAEKKIKIKVKIRKNRDATYLLTQYAFHTISFIMYMTSISLFMAAIFGYGPVEVGFLLAISGVSRAIVRFTLFKPTLRWLGEKKMTVLGLIILVVCFFLTMLVTEPVFLIILMVIISFGVSCSRGLLISKITHTVSPKEMGKINGLTTTLDSVAQIIGPIVGAFLIDLNPVFLSITIGSVAFLAFIMAFKKITPIMLKEQEEFLHETE